MNLKVKESRIGLGAFLLEPVKRGGVIVDWSDHPLFADPPRIPPSWRFVEISPGILVGPVGPEKYPDAYINHSCAPNSKIVRPHLIALQDIAADEEITFDYATLYTETWLMKCRCGTEDCRGTIFGTIS